jgi:hypothetical protein
LVFGFRAIISLSVRYFLGNMVLGDDLFPNMFLKN